jgi:hypothetical protein
MMDGKGASSPTLKAGNKPNGYMWSDHSLYPLDGRRLRSLDNLCKLCWPFKPRPTSRASDGHRVGPGDWTANLFLLQRELP